MGKGLFMSKQQQFVYRQVYEFVAGRLSRQDVATLLKKSERTVSRLAERVKRLQLAGVIHGNKGRAAHNKSNSELKKRVMKLVVERYYDFNMLHCLEMLNRQHNLRINRETFRKWCHERQMVKKKRRRRSRLRQYRARMPAEGYLLQMDGSPHQYNGKDHWTLILAIDDATSDIPYAEFFSYETTAACMKVLREIILRKGVPRALYVDKAGWAGGGKRIEFTQFHRACEELGIQVIYANSPEAKGRVERAFATFQDRIVPELRINKIKTMMKANLYLRRSFLPNYWRKRNVIEAQTLTSEYRKPISRKILDEILCFKYRRAVARNQCVSINGDLYGLKHPKKISLQGKRVEVRAYETRPFAIFFDGIRLRHSLVKRHRPHVETEEERLEKLDQYFREFD